MTVDITEREREYLLELLRAAYAEVLHELHHTDTLEYKDLLKQKTEIIEGLQAKLGKATETDQKDGNNILDSP